MPSAWRVPLPRPFNGFPNSTLHSVCGCLRGFHTSCRWISFIIYPFISLCSLQQPERSLVCCSFTMDPATAMLLYKVAKLGMHLMKGSATMDKVRM